MNGFVSAAYTYNANSPHDKLNQFRVFDFDDRSLKLDEAELVVQRPVAKANDFGFRVDLTSGQSVPEVAAAYGMFRDKRTGAGDDVDVHQLFVSYIAPLGRGLRIDAGKTVTHFGNEVIEGFDGYNDNYSRGFLFGYGIPFTHTGLKATYPFNDTVSAMVGITNGWDDVHDNNKSKSVYGQLALTPTKSSAVYLNFMTGPERTDNNHDQRTTGEVVATWKPEPRWSLAFDGLYGHDENAVAPGHDAIWKSVAAYTKFAFTDRLSLAFRGETFADNGGTRTGTPQTLLGFTVTPEFILASKPSRWDAALGKFDGKLVVRGDLRLDHSDREVFQRGGALRRQQFTSALNVIYVF